MEVGSTDAGFFDTDLDVVRPWRGFWALDHFEARCCRWLKKSAHSGDYRSATLIAKIYSIGSNLRL